MKSVVRKIDRALKRLYDLGSRERAEDFIVSRLTTERIMAGNLAFQGALIVRSLPETRGETPSAREVSLGIYLSEGVIESLSGRWSWQMANWSMDQLKAFIVATEEVSHFHYLLHHAHRGRSVTQLELEIQGDIDKFLMTFFAATRGGKLSEKAFDRIFDQFFLRFRLSEGLSEEQKARYLDANRLASRFLRKHRNLLLEKRNHERAFRLFRRFFRMNVPDKMSLIGL